MGAAQETIVNCFYRWGAEAPNESYAKKEFGEVLAISLGLGALFNEDVEAEREWMNAPHPRLGGAKPINFVRAGQTRAVLDLVDDERVPW